MSRDPKIKVQTVKPLQKGAIHNVSPASVLDFLRTVMPFKELAEDELSVVARACKIDFFPQGTRLLTEKKSAVTHLYLIQQGGVKAFIEDEQGGVMLKDYRGEGSYFGALGIIRGTPANLSIETVEDTFCYLLPKEVFTDLLENHHTFAHFYLKSFSEQYVGNAYDELRNIKVGNQTDSDLYLFTLKAGEIAKEVLAVSASTTIQQAAKVMSEASIGSLIIHEDNNENNYIGIITDTDLRKKVIAEGLDYQVEVRQIMSSPLITVLSQDLCFDVLLKMMATGIHHLVVERAGQIVGVLTSHDIMLLQGKSPYYLFKEIIHQQEIAGLYPLAQRVPEIVRNLIREGGKADHITRLITMLNDYILERLLILLEQDLGPPPVSYCWLLLGSEGRREQTFKTDQDNAIVYSDPETEEQQEQAKAYFRELAEKAIYHLSKCGYPLCPGEVMANNPKWCQPYSVWQDYFEKWIRTPQPKEVLNATIFFDFRSGFGDELLAKNLRQHLIQVRSKNDLFLLHLGRQCLTNRAPLSFFNNFIVEKNGEHKNRLDIKSRGVLPFVDFARVLSLKYGHKETNTLARLKVLSAEHHIPADLYTAIVEAYEIQMQLRLIHQLQQMESGKLPDNFLHPNELTELERKMLKDAFRVIERIQNFLESIYPSG